MPHLRLRDRTYDLPPGAPLLMGVLNASPESFSDGREATSVQGRLERGHQLLAEGADMVDIGGESGVTHLPPLSPSQEIDRVVPLVSALVETGATVSVDTWKAPVALAVLEAGAHMINDVSGLLDPVIAEHCGRFGAGLVLMHTRARPKSKELPAYDDVVGDVRSFLEQRMAMAIERGVRRDQIVLDPGPDFAKTPAQTVEVLRSLACLAGLDRPLLLAVSRKDFIGALTGRSPRQRLAGTLAAVGEGVDAGAALVRVHDVGATRDYLAVRQSLRGRTLVDPELRLEDHLRRES